VLPVVLPKNGVTHETLKIKLIQTRKLIVLSLLTDAQDRPVEILTGSMITRRLVPFSCGILVLRDSSYQVLFGVQTIHQLIVQTNSRVGAKNEKQSGTLCLLILI